MSRIDARTAPNALAADAQGSAPTCHGRERAAIARSPKRMVNGKDRSIPRRPRTLATSDAEMRRAWYSLITRYPWGCYCHFTFTHRNRSAGAWRELRSFIRRVERFGGGPVPWLALLDLSESGRLHFHTLLGPVAGLTTEAVAARWWAGRERIVEVYDPSLGGIAYMVRKIRVEHTADERIELDLRRNLGEAFGVAGSRRADA